MATLKDQKSSKLDFIFFTHLIFPNIDEIFLDR